jgi:hypothetical protein
MYDLAVNRTINLSGHLSNIDEIIAKSTALHKSSHYGNTGCGVFKGKLERFLAKNKL